MRRREIDASMLGYGLFMGGLGLGMTAMYLFDPDRGRARRSEIAAGAGRATRATARSAGDALRYARDATRDAVEAVGGRLEDPALLEKVRRHLRRWASNAEALEVRAEGGRVTLSGGILADEVDRLIAAVSRIRGVREVINRLEPHDAATDEPATAAGEHERAGWAPAVRLAVGASGGALVTWAALRRDPLTSTLGVIGLGLLTRSVTNRSFKEMAHRRGPHELAHTIEVATPIEDVHRIFSRPELFPRFMSNIAEVRRLDGGRLHWKARGPAGSEAEWDARITRDEPPTLIAWQSEPGSELPNEGEVRLERTGERTTTAHVRMTFSAPAGAAVAKLLGRSAQRRFEDDLERLRRAMEAGETATWSATGDAWQTSAGEQPF